MQYSDEKFAAGDGALSANTQTVIAFPYTGDYRIDVLLDGLSERWNYPAALGTPTTVTYSFMTAKPIYGGTDDGDGDTGFEPFTPQQMAAVRDIFARLQTELNIRFTEVADSTFSYGQIRFGDNYQQYSAGYTWLPNSTGNALSGDVWLDVSPDSPGTRNPIPGTYGYATLVHEIGHALGLKHPGNYNANSGGSTEPGNYLGTLEDNVGYSIMSYNTVPGGQERDWYGVYDLLALKKLYGAGTWGAGDSNYSYTDSAGTMLEVIDDASGYDTLDLSGMTQSGATVDMRLGAFSSIGRNYTVAATNNLSIDFTTVIEKFIGTKFADHVTGNDANNAFMLGNGANTADGGAGIDTALYTGSRSGFAVASNGANLQVSAGSISDTLTNIERVEFTDRKLAFDIQGNAGIVAKVIGAVFGDDVLTAHPDFVTIGLSLLDNGTSYLGAAQLALNARLGSASNADVVDLLYTNVVGKGPSHAELAAFVAPLDAGSQTQAQLAVFASEYVANATNIDLVGLAQHGLVYA
ncbi:MAG: M10 family metallopeptidase C-terminal domain-containing protein [Pseudomonadota bacterium]